MKAIRAFFLLIFAVLAGVLLSEWLYRSDEGRNAIREFAARAWASPEERDHLAIEKNLRAAASNESVSAEEIAHELDLLRFQFADDLAFSEAIESVGYSDETLRAEIVEHLQARLWIERQIEPEVRIGPTEARQFFDANGEAFTQPQRYRASHVFLAAPPGTTPELVAEKQSAIQGLAVRILAGEILTQIAVEASEDEATKERGGDLGYFSALRMPPDFMTEVEKLRVVEISAPLRLQLGFHIVQLIGAKPRRAMAFEEVRGEIAVGLANERRAGAVGRLVEALRVRMTSSLACASFGL